MAGRYTDEEVDEILRRAIERQRDDATKLSHDDLVAAAGEIGIAPGDVEAAIAEVRAGKAPAAKKEPQELAGADEEDDATLLAHDRSSRRAKFLRHFATYLVVNAFLAGMNVLTGGPWWFLWVVLGWGIGVALQGMGLLIPEDPVRKKNRLRRLHKHRDRERRRDRARAKRVEGKQRQKDFEKVVQQGVGMLLATAARKIEEAVDRQREEERRRQGVRVDVGRDDKVRVEVPHEESVEAERGTTGDAHKQRG